MRYSCDDRSRIGSTNGLRNFGRSNYNSNRIPVDLCYIRLFFIECNVERSQKMALFGRNSYVIPVFVDVAVHC